MQESAESARFCGRCGARSDDPARYCADCGAPLADSLVTDHHTLAALLTEFGRLRDAGRIDAATYATLRAVYEPRLQANRPRRVATAAAQSPAADAAAMGDGAPLAPLTPAEPPKPPGQTFGQWAAARQADILLYLGAFVLTVAALTFVNYQGAALGDGWRVLILALYTSAFLGLGVTLPRWERVREAGPVFLALGALLVPVTWLALRSVVLNTAVSDSLMLLIAATSAGVLYFTLAVRGYGRWYALLGVSAALVAWGGLARTARVPWEWVGAWYVGACLLLNLAALRPSQVVPWLKRGALVPIVPSVLWVWGASSESHATAAERTMPVVGLLLATATAAVGARAWRSVSWRIALPPLAMAVVGSAVWAVFDTRGEWLTVWVALTAIGYLALVEFERESWWRRVWRGAAGVTAAFAVMIAYIAATTPDTARWQLPSTHAIILVGIAWDTWRRRGPWSLLLPVFVAITATTTLWAADIGVWWWTYPWLAVAVVLVVSRHVWTRSRVWDVLGWPYALLVAVVPPLLLTAPVIDWGLDETTPRERQSMLGLENGFATHPLHGMTAFAMVAVVFLAGALLSGGRLTRLGRAVVPSLDVSDAVLVRLERQTLARLSSAPLLAAAAYFNDWRNLGGVDAAWVYAGIGVTAWLTVIAVGRLRPELLGILAPGAMAALAIAVVTAEDAPGARTLILTLGVVGPALASLLLRPAWTWLVASVFLASGMASLWQWTRWERSALPLSYAGVALALWAGLLGLRRYERSVRGWSVTLLSWGWWPVAVGVAWGIVLLKMDAGIARGRGAILPVRSLEWYALVVVVALTAVALTIEGLRLGRRVIAIAGTAGTLLALLLCIAIAQPTNVQAYTVPVGLYLLALALVVRPSPPLLGKHMSMAEGVLVAGMVVLVLPAVEQGLSPGGGLYGLEVLGMGTLFLLAGAVVSARWLITGGVLSISGVALRYLLTDVRPPYWLTLGVLGMVLLGVGLLLLLQREAWDRARDRLRVWWLGPMKPI